jgi:hypothetical protein
LNNLSNDSAQQIQGFAVEIDYGFSLGQKTHFIIGAEIGHVVPLLCGLIKGREKFEASILLVKFRLRPPKH